MSRWPTDAARDGLGEDAEEGVAVAVIPMKLVAGATPRFVA